MAASRAALLLAVALLCVACGSAIEHGPSSGHKALDDNDGLSARLSESDDDLQLLRGRRGGGGVGLGASCMVMAGSNRAGNDEEDEEASYEEDHLGEGAAPAVTKPPNFNQFGGSSCDAKSKDASLSKPSPIDKWIQVSKTYRSPTNEQNTETVYSKTNTRNAVYACFCGDGCGFKKFAAGSKTETPAEEQKRLTEYCDHAPKYKKKTDGTKVLTAGAPGGKQGQGFKVANMGECFQPCIHLVYWKSVQTYQQSKYTGGHASMKVKVEQLAFKYTQKTKGKNGKVVAAIKVPDPTRWSYRVIKMLGKTNMKFIRAIGCRNYMHTSPKFRGFPQKTKAVFWPLFNEGCTEKEFTKGKCNKYLKWAKKQGKKKSQKTTTTKKKKSATIVKNALSATSTAKSAAAQAAPKA